jgi:UDP-2-acetamido-2-deoxy-ribo-hexuluronate aminotransferase
LHLQGAFSKLGYKAGDFPVSESVSQRIFSLPMHPYLDDVLINKIAEIIYRAI